MLLRKVTTQIIFTWISFIFHQKTVDGGKTATKVGLAGIATVAGGGTDGYHVVDQHSRFNGFSQGGSGVDFKNDAERLKYDLIVKGQYDRVLRPVRDPQKITEVVLDVTLRQILDLDEKNQVLKTYIWMKYLWIDEFLIWNETEYGGIDRIWLSSSSLWRPDIVIYEETGQREFSSRLPYYRINSAGLVSAAEPVVIETTCSVDILFFPFDFQRCSFTFTSWTFPSDKIDIFSRRNSESMLENTQRYFLKTGEWSVHDIYIVKTSQNFAAFQESSPDVSVEEEEEVDDDHDHHDETPTMDTSRIRKMTLDITKTVEEVYPDRLTAVHWSDIKFTFILRRTSSLHMQSMLFPAILLTTVAVLGFYLPPDSGERIGLQITILLTFMVFLLTVGEMFPASTGPFLGVYYVLCMVLLGINLFMTVLVLHLHYMPSAAVMGTKKGGGLYLKPVPKWVRILLRIAKFRFRKTTSDGRTSPTSHTVAGILETGHLATKVASASEPNSPKMQGNENDVPNGGFASDYKSKTGVRSESFESEKGHTYVVCTESSSYPGRLHKKRVSPTPPKESLYEGTIRHTQKNEDSQSDTPTASENSEEISHSENGVRSVGTISNSSIRSKSHSRRQRNLQIDEDKNCRLLNKRLVKSIEGIKSYLKTQSDHLHESNIGDDIEKEWKAISRTIDRLCMQTYLAILILSHIIIIGIAIVQNLNYDHTEHIH